MKTAIAIHGGAGTILRSEMSPELEADYRRGLEEALIAGSSVLEKQGSALDAAEAAVRIMEDNVLFNAGRGSVFNHEGKNEMDASIMCGLNLTAGAIAEVRNVKNPVSLARVVMEKSGHVFLCGRGAEEFAKDNRLFFETDEYFFSKQRYDQWQQLKNSGTYELDHTPVEKGHKFGTVGAVTLDSFGNIAAATSTGGMTNKKFGRIGDSPLIGAGTYANNNTCAVSCTGHGEFFMRAVVAYDVSCLMEYKGLTLQQACDLVVMDKLVKLGGEGGLIALDRNGNISLTFNSDGMYRGYKKSGEDAFAAIYKS
jgi:beta-aspartyl-peptidase (threonine type)